MKSEVGDLSPVQVTSNIFMLIGSTHLGGISDILKGVSQTVRTDSLDIVFTRVIHFQALSLLARKDHMHIQSSRLSVFSLGQRFLN